MMFFDRRALRSARWMNSVLSCHERTDRLLRDHAAHRIAIADQSESYAWRKLLAAVHLYDHVAPLRLAIRHGQRSGSFIVYVVIAGNEVAWLPCVSTGSTPQLKEIARLAYGRLDLKPSKGIAGSTDGRRFIPDKTPTRLIPGR